MIEVHGFLGLFTICSLSRAFLPGPGPRGRNHQTSLIRMSKQRSHTDLHEIADRCFIVSEGRTPIKTAILIELLSSSCDRVDVLASYHPKRQAVLTIRLLQLTGVCNIVMLMHAFLCFAGCSASGGCDNCVGESHHPANTGIRAKHPVASRFGPARLNISSMDTV